MFCRRLTFQASKSAKHTIRKPMIPPSATWATGIVSEANTATASTSAGSASASADARSGSAACSPSAKIAS
jgi:hypothetical protein